MLRNVFFVSCLRRCTSMFAKKKKNDAHFSAAMPGRCMKQTQACRVRIEQFLNSGLEFQPSAVFWVWWCGICEGPPVRRSLHRNAFTQQRTKPKLSPICQKFVFFRPAELSPNCRSCSNICWFETQGTRPCQFAACTSAWCNMCSGFRRQFKSSLFETPFEKRLKCGTLTSESSRPNCRQIKLCLCFVRCFVNALWGNK